MKSIAKIYRLISLATAVALLSTSCGGAKLSTANEQMERGEYYDAAKTYRKLYNKLTKKEERTQRGVIAYKMAECYRRLNQSARASAAYQNAIRYGYPDSMATLRLAQMQHAEGKYPAAIKSYEEFLMRSPGNEDARLGLEGARMAQESRGRRSRYIVKQPKLINSRRADFSPMYYGKDGDVLYYTTTNEKVTGTRNSEITGMKKSDIWVMRKNEKGEWQRPEAVEGELNTELEEGIISFTPDGSTMYLTRARREPNANTGVEIYTSQRSDAKWSAPQKLEITHDTISSYGHPAVSPDGTWLYFTSDMPATGGKDIWRINLKDRAGSLENMGTDINTKGDECFPYVLTDSVLIFASNGHPGYGGLDLFRATLQPSGRWKVENMGQPLNSAADDFGITYQSPDREQGFFSSNRGDGRGYDHIYSFELPDLVVNISGYVLDTNEEPIANAVVRIVGKDGSIQKAVTRNDGTFTIPITPGVEYVMQAGARGFLNARQEFTADDVDEDAEYAIDFTLASIKTPNIVDNIFYDFGQATLRPESEKALEGLVKMLKDNPGVKIEFASHTDRWGDEKFNLSLSERRAKAVVDYLITHGIPETQLQYLGLGKSHPMTVNARFAKLFPQFEEGDVLTEEFIEALEDENDKVIADQINRRTEFKVISVDNIMY